MNLLQKIFALLFKGYLPEIALKTQGRVCFSRGLLIPEKNLFPDKLLLKYMEKVIFLIR